MSPELALALSRSSSLRGEFTEVNFVSDPPDDGPLHLAVIRQNRVDVKVLVDNGADVNALGDMSYTPLHDAVWKQNVVLVEFLISRGAKKNVVNEFGKTPMTMLLAARSEIPRRVFTELKQLLR